MRSATSPTPKHLRKPSHWIVRLAILTCVGVVLALWLVLQAAQSPPGRAFILRAVNKMLPGTIRSDYWHLELLSGRLAVGPTMLLSPQGDTLAGFGKLVVRLELLPLLQRRIVIGQLDIDALRARIITDSSGVLNLLSAFPESAPKKDQGSSQPLDFTLRKGTLSIDTLVYIDMRSALIASMGVSEIDISAATADTTASLNLNLGALTLTTPQMAIGPLTMNLGAQAKGTAIDTVNAVIDGNGLHLSAAGNASGMPPHSNVALNLSLTQILDSLSRHIRALPPLVGRGDLSLAIDGPIANPAIVLHVVYGGAASETQPRDSLLLHASVENMQAHIDSLIVFSPGGGSLTAQASCALDPLFPNGLIGELGDYRQLAPTLSAVLESFDLYRYAPPLQGAVSGSIQAEIDQLDFETATGQAVVDIHSPSLSIDTVLKQVPFSLTTIAKLDKGKLHTDSLKLDAATLTIRVAGHYTPATNQILATTKLSAPDLTELSLHYSPILLSGALSLNLDIQGKASAPRVILELLGDSVAWDTLPAAMLVLNGELNPDGIAQVTRLDATAQGIAVQIVGDMTLFEPGTMIPRSPMVLGVTTVDIAADLAASGLPLSGLCTLTATASGPLPIPSMRVLLKGSELQAYGLPVQQLFCESRLVADTVTLDSLAITTAGGTISAEGSFALSHRSYTFLTRATDLALTQLAPSQERELSGALNAELSGQGSLAQPAIWGAVTIDSLMYDHKHFDPVNIQIEMDSTTIAVTGTALSDVNVRYQPSTGAIDATMGFNATPLAPWFALAGMSDFGGTLTGNVNARGHIDSIASADIDLALTTLEITHKDTRLLSQRNFAASIHDRTLSIKHASFAIMDTGSLDIRGTAVLDGPLDLQASAHIPLQALALFDPELKPITGDLALTVKATGSTNEPALNGRLVLTGAAMTVPGTNQNFSAGNATIGLAKDRLSIESLSGAIDDGSFWVRGDIGLLGWQPSWTNCEIGLNALPVQIPEMLNARIGANLRWRGPWDTATVSGNITVQEGLYYQDIKINILDALNTRQRPPAPKNPAADTGFLSTLLLDIKVTGRQPFEVDNNLAQLRIDTDLQIGGTAAVPLLRGRAAVREGTITYQKKQFVVSRGVVDFLNPYRTEATVDITGEIMVRTWKIELTISGTPEELLLNLTSTPPEEHQDILSLLVLGRTTSELTQIDAGSGQSTEQLLARVLDAAIGDDLRKATGLDVLSVEMGGEQDEGEEEGIRITMGKKISRRLTTTYEFETVGGNITEQQAGVSYQLFDNLDISGYRSSLATFGGQIRFRLEFP